MNGIQPPVSSNMASWKVPSSHGGLVGLENQTKIVDNPAPKGNAMSMGKSLNHIPCVFTCFFQQAGLDSQLKD